MSAQIIRPARSMSYNDIKKRRLLRESKSKSKLKCSQASTEIIQTEKKVYSNPIQDIFANERPNQMQQIKELVAKKTLNSNLQRDTIKKVNKGPIIDFSERVQATQRNRNILTEQDKQPEVFVYRKSKETVRGLIEEAKSQRKLLKYNELRNKFKLSKSKSKSKSARSLLSQSKLFSRQSIHIETTPEKPKSPIKGVKHSHRVKKFESVKEYSSEAKHNFRYLVNAQKESSEFFKNNKRNVEKENSSNVISGLDLAESTIEMQKQSSVFDSQQNKVLEEILKPKNKSLKHQDHEKGKSEQERILNLLELQPNEIYKYLGKKQRQKKLLSDLQKLNKKFPKGFFKL